MSTINTNGIDVNYPIPGQNNSTQGFRNNFTSIKTNLNTAGSEITDLQNKVVLKSALANTVLNNDMANTLIANASTLQFRATTYNLGNALVGNANVDCSLGDLQYGNLAGNVTLNFGSWAPTNTQSTVKLQLGRPNNEANYTITFSANAVINQNSGWSLLENSGSNGGLTTLTFPYDVTQINLTVTSTDCGNTLYVEPTNRPFQTTAIQNRSPSPVGYLGDVAGTVAVDANYFYVCTDNYDATTFTGNAISATTGTNIITFNSALSSNVVVNMPVVFDTMYINGTSVTSFGGINAGQIYYVKTKPSSTTITISDALYEGNAGSTLVLSTVSSSSNTNMDATFYEGSSIWKSTKLLPIGDPTTIDNLIVSGNATIEGNLIVNGSYTFENVTSLSVEDPIIEIGRGPNGTPLVANDGKDRGEQLWYYSGSEKSAFIGWDDSQGKLIAATDVSVTSDAVTINSYGNFRVGNLDATNVVTSNLTTLGTFTASTISGNINAFNLDVSGVANIPTVGDIRIGGGLNGYYLITDGTGNLSWTVGSGSYTGNGTVAGSNTQIQFNNAGSFGGSPGFTFDQTTSLLSVPGNINATGSINATNVSLSGALITLGNITGANLVTGGVLSVTGNANVGNLGTGGLITAIGNVTGANLVTSGVLSVTGNANVGNLGTAGVITATGNVSGGNLTTAGALNVTGNANVGNLGTAGLITATGNVTAGNLVTSNYIIVSASNNITASGTIQSNATVLTSSINIITSGANNSGVKLPVAQAGMRIIVRNSTSNYILVYPNVGAAIEPTLADYPYTLNASTSMEFFCSTGGASGQWFTLF